MPFAHYPEVTRAYFGNGVERKSSLIIVMERLAALTAKFERPSA